jgi:hypothetical protein
MRSLAWVGLIVGLILGSAPISDADHPQALLTAIETTAQPEHGCLGTLLRGPTPVGATPCPGVRPGSYLEISFPNRLYSWSCTLNFLFQGNDGRRYIATAGHCPLDDGQMGRFTWRSGKAPIANIYVGDKRHRVGEFVYAILDDDSDFALIRLDEGVKARPRMCHFGGPTGINDDLSADPTILHHYGQGIGTGQIFPVNTLPARSALAPNLEDAQEVTAYGAVYEVDSGSPVISSDGRAVGVMVALRVNAAVDGEGNLSITRLTPQVADAEDALGIDLRLLKAPLS